MQTLRPATPQGDIEKTMAVTGLTREQVEEALAGEWYRNDQYTVVLRDLGGEGGLVHLSIKRNDREPIHDWRDLQEIKNQLVGPECEFIELYPAESRRVDSANQYHLWGFRDASVRIPLGFNERLVHDDPALDAALGSRQRRFRKGDRR